MSTSQGRKAEEICRKLGVSQATFYCSRVMDAWAVFRSVQWDFIRPGKPVENSIVESFNGRLRDECLNVNVFFSVRDAQQKLDCWKADYNGLRPHGALDRRSPQEFLAGWTRNLFDPLSSDLDPSNKPAGFSRQGNRIGVAFGHGLDRLRQLTQNMTRGRRKATKGF